MPVSLDNKKRDRTKPGLVFFLRTILLLFGQSNCRWIQLRELILWDIVNRGIAVTGKGNCIASDRTVEPGRATVASDGNV